jgi:hypothetical protein
MNPLFIEPIFNLGKSLIERVFPDKEKQAAERATAELELLKAQQDGTFKGIELQLSAILAEAQSPDPWTSRARPSFLYVMYIMILFAIPMGFLSAYSPSTAEAVANGMKSWLAAIPTELYTLFGVGYTGYAVMRGVEKIKGTS